MTNLVRRVENLEARPPVRVVPAEPVSLDTPADVLAVIGEQVNAVRGDAYADPAEKARTLGFLAGLALRAMETRDLVARLEAVERVLKLREKTTPPEPRRRGRSYV
jgi:hypothetical protein